MTDEDLGAGAARRTMLVALVAAVLLLCGMGLAGASAAALTLSGLTMTLVTALTWCLALPERGGPAMPVRLSPLPSLAARAQAWVAEQRDALPPPAIAPLDAVTPQLDRLPSNHPAADAIRTLIGVELPNLVPGYHAVPPAIRARPRADGRTADAHLVEGLGLIGEEVVRLSEQLGRDAADEMATQRRFLQLKYRDERP